MLTNEIRAAHARLSMVNSLFLDYVEKTPGCFEQSNFNLLKLSEGIFQLQPWPTFVSRDMKREMVEAGTTVFNLIRSIPARLFDNDPGKISKYFEIAEDDVNMMLDGANKGNIDYLLGRGDYILASDGFKCLEYNVASSLGGWQVPLWESLAMNAPLIATFFQEAGIRKLNHNLIALLMQHVVNVAVDSSPPITSETNQLNGAIVLPREDLHGSVYDLIAVYLGQQYQKELIKKAKHLAGELIFCDYASLENVDNCLYHQGKRIHSIIDLELDDVKIPGKVRRAFRAGNLLLFNGPITDLLCNKLNLVLLSEHENDPLFNPQEQAVIKKYIPWSRKIAAGPSFYGGKKINLEAFILTNKDRLVIKPGEGYGGAGVQVGRFTTPEIWRQSLETALTGKTWLVQELIEAAPYLYQDGEKGSALHDAVWGFFVFGSLYAGQWVRIMPRKDSLGVINCHQGAKVSIIFEVES